jgi:hypothetical protein
MQGKIRHRGAHKHPKVTPKRPGGSESSRVKGLPRIGFSGERFTLRSSVTASSSRSRAARSGGSFTTRPCTALKVRAASTSLPTLFPSPTGSRLSPSSSHRAIHEMAQTGRSNVRHVDPQRRYTVMLGPSWNAPFDALPHDDRAGTHDSADGQCGSYASIGCGQAATKTFRQYPQRVSQGLLHCGISSRLLTAVVGRVKTPAPAAPVETSRRNCAS